MTDNAQSMGAETMIARGDAPKGELRELVKMFAACVVATCIGGFLVFICAGGWPFDRLLGAACLAMVLAGFPAFLPQWLAARRSERCG